MITATFAGCGDADGGCPPNRPRRPVITV